jgi:hypothetical protein
LCSETLEPRYALTIAASGADYPRAAVLFSEAFDSPVLAAPLPYASAAQAAVRTATPSQAFVPPETGLPTGAVLQTLGPGLASKFRQLAKDEGLVAKRYARMGFQVPTSQRELTAAAGNLTAFYRVISPVVTGKKDSVFLSPGVSFSRSDLAVTEKILFSLLDNNSSATNTAGSVSPRSSSTFMDIVWGKKTPADVWNGWVDGAKQKIADFFQPVVDTYNKGVQFVTGLFAGSTAAAVTEQRRVDIANTPGAKSADLLNLSEQRQGLVDANQSRFDTLTEGVGGSGAAAAQRLEELLIRGGSVDNILLSDIVRLDAVGRNELAAGTWMGTISRDGLSGDIIIRFKTQGPTVRGTISHTFYTDGKRSRTTGNFEGVVDEGNILRGNAIVRNSSGSGLFTIAWGPLNSGATSLSGLLYQEDRIVFNIARTS